MVFIIISLIKDSSDDEKYILINQFIELRELSKKKAKEQPEKKNKKLVKSVSFDQSGYEYFFYSIERGEPSSFCSHLSSNDFYIIFFNYLIRYITMFYFQTIMKSKGILNPIFIISSYLVINIKLFNNKKEQFFLIVTRR